MRQISRYRLNRQRKARAARAYPAIRIIQKRTGPFIIGVGLCMTKAVRRGPAAHIPAQRTVIAAMASLVILKFIHFLLLPQDHRSNITVYSCGIFWPIYYE